MTTSASFQVQMGSIMEVLTKTALTEITKLVDDASAALRLEICRSQRESEALKCKLLVLEGELRAARGCEEGTPNSSLNIDFEVKVCDEFREAHNSTVAGKGNVAVERVFDGRLSTSPAEDEQYVLVEKKKIVPDGLDIKYEPVDGEQDWSESVLLSGDWLEEDPRTSQSEAEQKIFEETSCGTSGAAVAAANGGEGPLCEEEELHMQPCPAGDPEKGLQVKLRQEPEGERERERPDHAVPLLGSGDLGLELPSGMVSEGCGRRGGRAPCEASSDASAEAESRWGIEGREEFICTCCGKTFPDALELQTHEEEQRGTWKRFGCSESGKAFACSSRKKPFACSGSDKTFSQSLWEDPGEEDSEAGSPGGGLSDEDARPFRAPPPGADGLPPGLRGREGPRAGDGPVPGGRGGLRGKRHYCLYCQKGYCKIARHLEGVHLGEPEVASAVRFPKNSKERRLRLHQLRNRGDFTHNSRVARTGAGELVVCRRFGPKRELGDFRYCLHCKGLFSKLLLWKHMKNCKLKPKEVRDQASKFRRARAQACWALPTPSTPSVSEDLKRLVSGMMEDDVFATAKEDTCILKLGEDVLRRSGGDGRRYEYIRHRLRTVAKLLVEVRKRTPLRKMEDLLTPSNFPHVESAVRGLAGFDEEMKSCGTPSLARRLSCDLQGICCAVEDEALAAGNSDLAQSARGFRAMLRERWGELVPSGAPGPVWEDEPAPPLQLRLVRDVKLLSSYLDRKLEGMQSRFRRDPTRRSYGGLAQAVLAQVMLFNRCPRGAVSAMPLAAFTSRDATPGGPLAEDDSVSGLERRLCRHFARLELPGRGGERALVLLKPAAAAALELLVLSREACEVPRENGRVFARPGALSCYRGGAAVRRLAQECGAEDPAALSSGRLRRHVAAILNVIGLRESGALADLFGRDAEASGRRGMLAEAAAAADTAEDDLRLAEMAAVLLAEDERVSSEFSGVDDDEDEEIDPKEPSSENNAEELVEAPAPEDADNDGSPQSPKLRIHCPKPGAPKRKWERAEVEAVERHMMGFIWTRKLPGKHDCLRCLQSEPRALKDRNWSSVKYYIKNRITAAKKLK
ncbi:uncharacterized protein LOC135255867 isoform X1 [Anguilla rostrata]|uniref:uncharacterized protein LOC135255867 isoform X1 n=1 Tax=Anguilla rostrata TaxID=7938 RepID=UPI0030D39248